MVVITDTQTKQVPATPFSPSQSQQVRALGSGFVIDRQGDIVTNDHVVQGATAIRIGFSDGVSAPATVVASDPSTDIAVVKVKAPPPRCIRSASKQRARSRSAIPSTRSEIHSGSTAR